MNAPNEPHDSWFAKLDEAFYLFLKTKFFPVMIIWGGIALAFKLLAYVSPKKQDDAPCNTLRIELGGAPAARRSLTTRRA